MDPLQLTIIIVLFILTIVFVGVGIFLVLVLKEFRETVKKSNKILDNIESVTDAVSNPITTVAGIVSGFTESLKSFKSVRSLFEDKKKGGK